MFHMKTTKCDAELRVRVPSELIQKLKIAAKKARRSYPDFVRISLEDASGANG
jgi:predicted DNA binding CopG/RHH family protein